MSPPLSPSAEDSAALAPSDHLGEERGGGSSLVECERRGREGARAESMKPHNYCGLISMTRW